MTRKPVLALGLAGAAGCLFPSLDGLTGATDAGDAALDVTTGDGATDATTDGTSDGGNDASSIPFCASHVDASFCDDFDDFNGQTFPKWTGGTGLDDGGSLARVDAGLSKPNAAVFAIASTSASAQITAELSQSWQGTVTRVHVVYDLFIEEADTTTSSSVETMEMSITAPDTSLLSIRQHLTSQSGFRFAAAVYPNGGQGSFPTIGPTVGITPQAWHHVDVAVDVGASPALGSLSLDGTPIVADAVIAGATFGPGQFDFTAGAYYANTPTSGWRFRIDNFAAWIE